MHLINKGVTVQKIQYKDHSFLIFCFSSKNFYFIFWKFSIRVDSGPKKNWFATLPL